MTILAVLNSQAGRIYGNLGSSRERNRDDRRSAVYSRPLD